MSDISPPQGMRKQIAPSPGDKTRLAYWKKRIFKPAYRRDGLKMQSPNFCVELQHKNKRIRWSLGPATPEAAAARARDLYMYLLTNGWEATFAKYRPQSLPSPDPTIGEFVETVTKVADLEPKTLRTYVSALRKIASDIGGFSSDRRRFDQGKGHQAWIERVQSMKLSQLNAGAVQAWKIAFIARAGTDPLLQRSAKVSANSFMRAARSLFSPKIIKHLNLQLPSPLPFSECQFEQRPSTKYRSSFSIQEVIATAKRELADTDPEAYKVFLLGTMVGLRRKEIDLLEWSSFRWLEGVIRIEPTEHFAPKSEDSIGDVACDAELMQIFRGLTARATDAFVIESDRPPQNGTLYNYYRCEPVFARLISWLRKQGIKTLKPLHTLRKEFGSVVCATYGIHAASRALRHSTVSMTDQYYTDSRKRTSVGLGHLLAPQKIVPFEQASDEIVEVKTDRGAGA
jgi:integrase